MKNEELSYNLGDTVDGGNAAAGDLHSEVVGRGVHEAGATMGLVDPFTAPRSGAKGNLLEVSYG